MTESEYRNVILPFLGYYWGKTGYYKSFTGEQIIKIGHMVLFCDNYYIPNAILILDDDESPIDGFNSIGFNYWNGKLVTDILNELNNAEI